MIPTCVVDTSVAFKWFLRPDEGGVAEAFALLEANMRGEIVLAAPASLALELANALRYSRHTEADVLTVVEQFDLSHLETYATTPKRLHAATILSYRHGISVYDALFLSLAEELDCPLLTADRRAFGRIDTHVEIRLL